MSMQENLPTTTHPGRGRNSGALYAQRKRKNDFANMCMVQLANVLKLWVDTMNDASLPRNERMAAAENIVRRAVGDVPKAPLEEGENDTSVGVHHTYTLRWLPPDPADTSKVIEPE